MKYACDRCGGSGKTPHQHIANGVCFKCEGRGTLPYNPQMNGDVQEAPLPDADAYYAEQERRFWENYDGEVDERERQQFWEENGFEAS